MKHHFPYLIVIAGATGMLLLLIVNSIYLYIFTNSIQFACMKNGDITTLSIVAILALSLLAVGVITALTIAEEADARKKSSTNIKQSIT
jgi:hypothetical protein